MLLNAISVEKMELWEYGGRCVGIDGHHAVAEKGRTSAGVMAGVPGMAQKRPAVVCCTLATMLRSEGM